MRLEAAGIGLAHARLRREEELTEADIVTYLAHSRVTEQRASEQMRALRTYAGDRPDIARAVRVISNDEDNHLAYSPLEARDSRGPAASHGLDPRRNPASVQQRADVAGIAGQDEVGVVCYQRYVCVDDICGA